tara:strand:- start:783 stop:1697 length:915 start_codon:yes stop_codon:yes gene_type:complete
MNNIFLYTLIIVSFQVFGGKVLTPQDYIDKYKDDAIEEMNIDGVPASITLAQGMLESGYGNSPLARKANNHFGIKCHNDWNGPIFRVDDDKKDECFRKYKSVKDSFRDHSKFLLGKKRYSFLFDLKITDYKGWAKGLSKAGYATNRKYARLLIDIIERYNLNQYVTDEYRGRNRKVNDVSVDFKPDNLESKIQLSDNWIKYINVKKGYTLYKISKETGVSLKRLYRYNECDKNVVLYLGDRVYLQPKKRKSKTKIYVFKEGDDLYRISQKFGVKLKYIYKRNNWTSSYNPVPGDVILLRGRKRN